MIISELLSAILFLLIILLIPWKPCKTLMWNCCTQFLCHFVTFEIHLVITQLITVKSLVISPICFLDGVIVVGSGIVSRKTWTTHLHWRPWQCSLAGVQCDMSCRCFAGIPLILHGSVAPPTSHFLLLRLVVLLPSAEAALTTTAEMKRLHRNNRLIPNTKLWINLVVPGYLSVADIISSLPHFRKN